MAFILKFSLSELYAELLMKVLYFVGQNQKHSNVSAALETSSFDSCALKLFYASDFVCLVRFLRVHAASHHSWLKQTPTRCDAHFVAEL